MDLRLNHVAVPARDIAENAAFYRALGLADGFARRDAGGRVKLQQMTGVAGIVEFMRDDSHEAEPGRHFSLTTADLQATPAALAERGIAPLAPVRRGVSGVDFVFIEDPSGNLVEITAPAT